MEWLGYPAVQRYKGVEISELPLNHAWVVANTTVDDLAVYSVRDDCFNCPYKLEKHLTKNQLVSWQVDAGYQSSWRILKTDRGVDVVPESDKTGWVCQMRPTFHEYGVYRLDITECHVKTVVPPIHTYYPLILFSLSILGICAVYTILSFLWRRRNYKKVEIAPEKSAQNDDTEDQKETVTTLHVFRGIILSLIIFASTGGGGYPIFSYNWRGLTASECLFFSYIWSIGVNVPSVMEKAFDKHSKCAIVRSIFLKSLIFVALGTAIDSTVSPRHNALWWPLQKIGITYFIVTTAYLLTVQRFEMKSKKIICKAISNLICLLWCWIISAFLLAIIIILISTFMSFNCLSNINLEDQRADYLGIKENTTVNCNNQRTEFVNQIIVGDGQKMINVNRYAGFSRGVLGIMSAIICMMIGLKAGLVYLQYNTHQDRLKLWAFWATLFGLCGLCVGGSSYPLNFNLWPISTITFISAASFCVFSVTYLVTEVWKIKSSILNSFGVTSLVVLGGHLLFSNALPFNLGLNLDTHLFYLLQNLWIVCLWMVMSFILYKKNVRLEI